MARIHAAVTTLLLVFLVAVAGTAYGQTPSPTPAQTDGIQASLESFPSHLGPEGVLRVGLQVTNKSARKAAGLKVQMAIYDGVPNRSSLERTYRGSLGRSIGSDTLSIADEIDPGRSKSITVEKPLSEIGFFRSAPDRVYPVRITVQSSSGAAKPIDSHMVFFAQPP
ncbi:MAG TPA: hypothetical protein VND22_03685, partial [Actinomycetota bacterium]|nr:hypothetical protein [Actinomycetota bacterium]